jgi:hypothetical protein
MAAIAIHFTIVDDKNKSSKTTIHVPTGFSLAAYLNFGQAMAQLIANISEGQLTEVSVSYPVDLSGATIRAAALAAADIFKKVFFQAASAVSGLVGKFFIPTYNEVNNVVNSDSVNFADPEVAALVSIIEDGVNVSGEIVQPIDLRGNDLELVTIGREVFRKF